jgi:membrane fusion protein (multidrug efflux system)
VAKQEQWPASLKVIGSAASVQGVTVSADLPGIVAELAFESGKAVQAGALLVRLDTRQEQAQLAAAEAQRELARLNLDRIGGLVAKGVTSHAEYDRVSAEHKQAEARAGEIRATIQRKTIRAPFSGMLGIRQVNLGQYLNAGDPVVPLQSLHPIYVNFGVPQQQVGALRLGGEVRATAEGVPGDFAGRITALDSVVDEATRNVRVQASFGNAGGRLRPGMFVETQVSIGAREAMITLPASAISYAPYGDSVFVVEDVEGPKGESYRGVRQQFVKLGGARGDQVAVLSGVKAGEEVVSSGVFKLRNGAAVLVNNQIQPGNNPAPKPENN